MQTLLHLQPRLRAIQAQREARGVDGPDLTAITSFAALVPDVHEERVSLNVQRLRDDVELPPFYLEQLLAGRTSGRSARRNRSNGTVWSAWHPEPASQSDDVDLTTTESQQRSQYLLEATAPVFSVLDEVRYPREGSARTRLSRTDLFQAGLRQGTDVARILDAHLIAPVRHDSLAPGDPFVQTTLYVVAPLFEPLTSALVWPTMVHLLNYLGRRNVSQIVGIFATGSYAGDRSRPLEDAASYAALTELEALTGLDPDSGVALDEAELPMALRKQDGTDVSIPDTQASGSRSDGVPRRGNSGYELSQWVGDPIFDRRYLLDREKSNQGLIHDSFELSVLVGNALEAMVTTDAGLHIDEQLGIDLRNTHERPYSLLGAATDYVPLDYLFDAVHEQEEKRLVREIVLSDDWRPGDWRPETNDSSPASKADTSNQPASSTATRSPDTDLGALGISREQILSRLVGWMPELFVDVSPSDVDELDVHTEFILPPGLAADMDILPPVAWAEAMETRWQAVRTDFERLVNPSGLDQAWGLSTRGAEVRTAESGLLSTAARHMRSHIVDLLAESPAGLRLAREHLAVWLEAVRKEQARVAGETSGGQRYLANARVKMKQRHWRGQYRRAALNHPTLSGALLRSSLLIAVMLLIAVGYWAAFSRPVDPLLDGATFLGVLVGSLAGGIGFYLRKQAHLQRLRRERVVLAQEELTALLRERVERGLLRAYERLAEMLREMDRALEETNDALRQWTGEKGMPSGPPVQRYGTHLYLPHVSDGLWQRCRDFLRTMEDQEGHCSDERLRQTWQSADWRRKLEELFHSSLESGVHVRRIHGTPGPAGLFSRLQGYTSGSTNASDDGVGQYETEHANYGRPLPVALHDLLRETVHEAVADVSAGDEVRSELVRELGRTCNLEHLLWRDDAERRRIAGLSSANAGRGEEQASKETLIYRYLEALRSNAKPAANFEVSDRLASHGIPVDFAAVSGLARSDLAEATIREFRATIAPTGDPFRISFVRTLHGLTLEDLETTRRYRLELSLLSDSMLQQISLSGADSKWFYRLERPRPGAGREAKHARSSGEEAVWS